jgi:hypothetical protein
MGKYGLNLAYGMLWISMDIYAYTLFGEITNDCQQIPAILEILGQKLKI